MTWRMFAAALLSVTTLIAVSTASDTKASASSYTRVSCTVNGISVYREDIPQRMLNDRRKEAIRLAHPDAMCVYLDLNRETPLSMDTGSPRAINSAFKQSLDTRDDLAAALAIISDGNVGSKYPDDIELFVKGRDKAMLGDGMGLARESTQEAAHKSPGSVLNMAIGIYREVSVETILAHWRSMQSKSKLLTKLTPTIDTVDNVSMLSLLKIPDEMVAQLCDELETFNSKCITAF